MYAFETQIMTHPQAVEFMKRFDDRVGTDRELNEAEDGEWYVVCLDLESVEVTMCVEIESEVMI